MSKFIIAINTGDYWNGGRNRAEAEATLDWLMHVGNVTEEDEPEIFCTDEQEHRMENWESIVEMMDDEIREQVHAELAPCTDEEFLERYCELHEQKYVEPFYFN